MLKKAGIVVAAAAAGLLAVSPLAFAGDTKGDHHGHGDTNTYNDTETNEAGNNSGGLFNVSDNEVNVPMQACNNDVSGSVAGGAVNDVTGAIAGAASFFGPAAATSEATDNEVRSCTQENNGGDDVASVD